MTTQWIADIDKQLLMAFNGSDSLFLDGVAITFTSSLTWIPLYLALFYLVIKNNENMTQIFLIVGAVLLCLLLGGGVDNLLVKPYVARYRPALDPSLKYTVDVVNEYREQGYSFFSAHAANTFSIALFFMLLVRSRLLSIALLLWSLLQCWTRLYLGVHYLADILAGLLWGAIAASLAYALYRRLYYQLYPRLNYVSMQYSSTGYSHNDIDIVLMAIVSSCCYVLLSAVIIV